jgi:hypothetical protein
MIFMNTSVISRDQEMDYLVGMVDSGSDNPSQADSVITQNEFR